MPLMTEQWGQKRGFFWRLKKEEERGGVGFHGETELQITVIVLTVFFFGQMYQSQYGKVGRNIY